jgi:hypothetical protein
MRRAAKAMRFPEQIQLLRPMVFYTQRKKKREAHRKSKPPSVGERKIARHPTRSTRHIPNNHYYLKKK